MTRYTLSALPAPTWNGLRDLDLEHWLWLDNDGVHLEPVLPPLQPAHATHLWGWASGRTSVRVRLDPDLPGGMVGAALHEGEPTESDRVPVDPDSMQSLVWSADDGRISADLPQRLRGMPDMLLHRVRPPGGWRTSAPLTFLTELGRAQQQQIGEGRRP